jgi:peptidoglycan/xylan/chitin deacetylase (PgdA/CDA1 family)
VTFDDGYRNLLSVALPVLRAYEVPATVFVITAGGRQRLWMDRLETCLLATTTPAVTWDGQRFPLASSADRLSSVRELMMRFDHLGRDRENALRRLLALVGDPTEQPDDDRDLLTWEEIRALREAGLEIGSHADCHEPLTERPSDEAESALTKSRETLEWQLGPGPYALSYPYGAWNKELARAVQVAGFSCAVTGDPGLNRTGANLFALRRLLVGADDDMLHLRASLSGVRSFWKFRAVYRNG